jgi:MraZ protein
VVFQGTSALLLDGKGRMQVPARHRDALLVAHQGQLTLTRHPEGYLLLFPRPVFEKFRDQLLGMSMNAAGWRRIFLGGAVDIELDASLRIQLPQELRTAAGFTDDKKEALLIGNGHLLELWEAGRHAQAEAKLLAEGMPDEIKSFVL